MTTKLQEIARKENWMICLLCGVQTNIEQQIRIIHMSERDYSPKQRRKLLDLNIGLNNIHSNLYFCIRDIKDIQQLRKEESKNES